MYGKVGNVCSSPFLTIHLSCTSIIGAKAKEEINFDSDDDLPGLNDNPQGASPKAESSASGVPPTPSPRQKTKQPQKLGGDLFADEDGLPGKCSD